MKTGVYFIMPRGEDEINPELEQGTTASGFFFCSPAHGGEISGQKEQKKEIFVFQKAAGESQAADQSET